MAIVLGLLIFIFVIVCVLLCLLVLIQSDKGGGISGAIGGGLGGANSLLGTQDTANILTRGTAIFGGLFLVLCIVISAVVGKANVSSQKSLLKDRAEKQENYSPSSILNNKGIPLQKSNQPAAPAAQQPTAPVQGSTPAVNPAQPGVPSTEKK
jgi:preprotein translocase subunit SecG